jgi:hypothetical protein
MNYSSIITNSNLDQNIKQLPPPLKTNVDSRKSNYKKSFYCAGILPYQVNELGEVYMLLGQDELGKWSDFGGKSEIIDNHDSKNTASREFFEETLNSVVDKETIDSMLQNEKNFKFIQSKTVRGLPYYMFVVRMPMLDSTRAKFLSTRKFLSDVRDQNPMYHLFDYKDSDWKFFEKRDIKWISLDTILLCLGGTKIEKQVGWSLRDIFKSTLENNINILIKLNLENGTIN